MKTTFYVDRNGQWWMKLTPPWVKGYRVSTLVPVAGPR